MNGAEQPPDVEEKQQCEREAAGQAKFPRLLECDNDSLVHVLIFAAITAFIFLVVAEGLKFSDSTTLALVVFFVMSIAGGVLGAGEKRAVAPAPKTEVPAQPDFSEKPQNAAEALRNDEPVVAYEMAILENECSNVIGGRRGKILHTNL
jgi:hypothetical protein